MPEVPIQRLQSVWGFIYDIMVVGVVTRNSYAAIHPLTWLHTQHKGLNQVSVEDGVMLDQEVDCWKILCLTIGLCATPHKQNCFGCVKISATTSTLTSGNLTPQILIPLIIV